MPEVPGLADKVRKPNGEAPVPPPEVSERGKLGQLFIVGKNFPAKGINVVAGGIETGLTKVGKYRRLKKAAGLGAGAIAAAGAIRVWTDIHVAQESNPEYGFNQATPSPEEVRDENVERYSNGLAKEGFGGLELWPLTDKDHRFSVIDPQVLELMVAKDGASALFPYVENAEGKEIPSEAIINNIAYQFNFSENEEDKNALRNNYAKYHDDPKAALEYLQNLGHPAAEAGQPDLVVHEDNIAFYKYATELILNDATPETWQDRIEPLHRFLYPEQIEATSTPEARTVPSEEEFNQITESVCNGLGADFGEIGGPLETLLCMPIDTAEMQEMAGVDYYASVYPKPLLEKYGLSWAVVGLFLLRAGPTWPKEVVAKASKRLDDIVWWFKLGQHERAIRDLAVLGKQAWERVMGEKRV